MSYPLIAPDFYKEYSDSWNREEKGDLPCEIIFTPAAAEYVFTLNNIDTVKLLMDHPDKINFQMYKLNPDKERDEAYEKSIKEKLEKYPLLQYYWPLRTMIMNILQRKEAPFESRMLVLNYALKAVQEIVDRNQAEAIPAFVSQFIAREEYNDVVRNFLQLNRNPGYSMQDGLAFLDIFNSNEQFGEIMNTIYGNLGIKLNDEKIDDKKFTEQVKKYLDLKQDFYNDFLKGNEHYIENFMITFVWSLSMPFADPSMSIWDNYVFFCALFNAIRLLLVCYTKGKTKEDLAYAMAVFAYQFHNTPKAIIKNVVQVIKDAGEGNNGDMALLVMG